MSVDMSAEGSFDKYLRRAVPPEATWQFPAWAIHPECTALAAMFASAYWAALAIPSPDRRHRRFYQRLVSELAIDDGRPVRTIW